MDLLKKINMGADRRFGIANVIVVIIAKWHREHLQEKEIIIPVDVLQENT